MARARVMSARELSRAYLARQLLLRRAALGPVQALRRLVAVQAQYSPSPYLALAARLEPFAIDDLEGCLRTGAIVKSTLMRGTLHLTTASVYPDIAALVHAGAVRHWQRIWGTRARRGVDTDALGRELADYLATPRTAEEIRAHVDALTGGALPGVFGWGLGSDSDVAGMSRVLQTASHHGLNGAVVSFGLDTLCKQPPDYFRRLNAVKQVCEQNHLELIPAIFAVGYGGGVLSHDRNLAEGLPVEDAPFLVSGGEARLVSSNAAQIANGGFEDYDGNRLKGFDFSDQPGEISFVDTQVKHSGKASLRLEHFTANPHGHGRVMQTIRVQPHRCKTRSLIRGVKTVKLCLSSSFPAAAFARASACGSVGITPCSFTTRR